MNADRRKAIDEAISQLEQIKSDIENLTSEEQDAYDALPESLQNGEKGEKMQEAINSLEEAANEIDNAMDNLSAAKE